MWSGCRQIEPGVIESSRAPGSWYAYMPQRAPGFCFITRHAMVWHLPEVELGYWQGLNTAPPHRVLMEARGHTFILHRRYVWDGKTFGRTKERDMMPSLLHDALYHALQNGAPLSRRAIDRCFLRRRREQKVFGAYGEYSLIRMFGGLYNRREGAPSLFIRKTNPASAPAPLELDRPEPLEGI